MLIKFVKEDNTVLYVGEGYDWRLQKKGLEGFASFEGKLTTTADYSRDGSTLDNIRLEDKKRTLKICNINWRSSDVERDKARRFFTYGTNYKIYITQGGETRWNEATLYRMAINEPTNEDYMLKLTLSFEFESPYLLSYDDFGKDIASLTPHFAFPWMSSIDKGTYVAVFNFDRSVDIYNDGDIITYVRIKISFKNPVTNPKVGINDGFIRFIGVYGKADHIEIDYTVNPPRITNNGENILGECDRASIFEKMYIDKGANTVYFDADNGTDEMSVSVYYNRQYTLI